MVYWVVQVMFEQIVMYIWVVVWYEIDYCGNLKVGESVEGWIWIDGLLIGVKFDCYVVFVKDGKMLVQVKIIWVIIDRMMQWILCLLKDVMVWFLSGV